MITVLGVFSMVVAAWLGYSAGTIRLEGGTAWLAMAVPAVYICGSIACLVMAFLCFGGEF